MELFLLTPTVQGLKTSGFRVFRDRDNAFKAQNESLIEHKSYKWDLDYIVERLDTRGIDDDEGDELIEMIED